MTRFSLLGLLALALLVAAPTRAQDAPVDTTALPTDSVRTVEPNPEKARELASEANDMYQNGDYEGALARYDEALVYEEGNARIELGRARALKQLQRFDESRTSYERTLALAQASDDEQAQTFARRELEVLQTALSQRASAQAIGETVQRAIDLLQTEPVTEAAAGEAYGLLEQARASGYDANLAAFYYAKALNALGRGAEAVPYAQTAVTASEGEADRSAYFIQLGLAQQAAGDKDAARAAFESAKTGAWAGWADHYLGQLDAEGAEG